ncbi:conserved hypothetical protein [Methanolacinia petrolearia DSM 11571]|uniref:Archaeal Type IV pilin N-terminal domain-containing protein n=1 Tax=Methanolacinia petrolearia (strain DSM 11571 / OCM 486 / SEBR 4847) TaxID=679926 RepID=E1RI11_METP4|nr:type IV pilin N-terminal domain-containing protein [Methanolacinia petrolearia]ADN35396.1 conserved hypothetical protein [Methanolacinia petrolearia DSM 11571]
MAPLEKNPDGVSPVVGVMLMLVIVIILAAVISAFSGGIAGNSDSGSLIEVTAETKIINSGYNDTSRFEINIISLSSPVSTKDLKLKTSWQRYDSSGVMISNDTFSIPGDENFNYGNGGVSPIGTGTGLPWDGTYANITADMNFGKYALLAGTSMVAYPSVYYVNNGYTDNSYTDSMQAILGDNWYELESGDVVSVKLIHVPSGRIIYDDDIYVNA